MVTWLDEDLDQTTCLHIHVEIRPKALDIFMLEWSDETQTRPVGCRSERHWIYSPLTTYDRLDRVYMAGYSTKLLHRWLDMYHWWKAVYEPWRWIPILGTRVMVLEHGVIWLGPQTNVTSNHHSMARWISWHILHPLPPNLAKEDGWWF